ncbi:MAG TPA: hypothetical protein VN734_17110 [Acidobacteriaceae bacterium]|nr:hypothetical protein [Acidobacteriaceae bacterium]
MTSLVITGLIGSPGSGDVLLSWSTTSTLQTTYTANGSFPAPDSGVTQIEVQALGAGGGGGAGPAASGEGYAGYGGAYVDAFFSPSNLAYPVAIVIGVGGVGATGPTWSSTGTAGTDTTFGTYITAQGGSHYNAALATYAVTNASSYTGEDGGYQETGGSSGDTTHAGAGGGSTQGTGLPPQTVRGGICSSGPGGTGGNAPGPYGNGGNGTGYGSGGGGGTGSPTFNGTGGNGAGGWMQITQTYGSPADSYNVYHNGVLIGNTTSTSFDDPNPPTGAVTYKVVAVLGGVEQTNGSQQIIVNVSPVLINIGGKFVQSAVYKAVELAQVGDIKPRIWPPKKNNTVQA